MVKTFPWLKGDQVQEKSTVHIVSWLIDAHALCYAKQRKIFGPGKGSFNRSITNAQVLKDLMASMCSQG